MPMDTIPGFRFVRTNDTRGAGVSAVYALYGDLETPGGYPALMWAAGVISQGHLPAQFIAQYTRPISASRAYSVALPLYLYVMARRSELCAEITS